MKRKTKNVSISPLAKGQRWPGPNEPVGENSARLAVKKGNPAVLARYLRQHTRDIIILAIADMIDPLGKSIIKLVPNHRRGRGRPPKRKIRKGYRGCDCRGTCCGKNERQANWYARLHKASRRGSERRNQTKSKNHQTPQRIMKEIINRALFGTEFYWRPVALSHIHWNTISYRNYDGVKT